MSNRDKSRVSIRRKLLLWLLIPLVCLCSLSAFVAYRLAEKFANESYDMLLLKSAESIAGRLMRNDDGIVVADLPRAAQAILRHSVEDQFYYQIADSYGHRLTGDVSLPMPTDTEDSGPRFRYVSIDGEAIRMCRISVQIDPSPDEIWVQVGETLNNRHKFLEQIYWSILAPQLVLVVLASLSVWIGIKHGLDPLEKLGKLLRARGRLDLSPVDIGNTPAELAPVTKALNELFSNANNHIHLQRQFIGNAAHQLRTPVTALKTYVEYAQRIKETKEENLDTVLNQMSEASSRVAHLVGRLLSLARSEDHSAKELEVFDLTEVVNEAAANLVHEALDRHVNMEFDLPDDIVSIKADRGDVLEMVTNLLDNAIKYTAQNGSVWVNVKAVDLNVALTIEDDGPGMDEEQKSKIFERFYRIPGTSSAGCGLGLSIVHEIAVTHNIQIEVTDRAGGGTVFRVFFSAIEKQKPELQTKIPITSANRTS